MLKVFKKLWNDKRGNILVIASATLPLLIGSAGLATDTIQWSLWKRQLQRAADSAAIAGVYDRMQTNNTDTVSSTVSRDLTLNQHTGIGLETGFPQIAFPADAGTQTKQVQVTLAVRKNLTFSSLFMAQAPQIRASATAASVPGTDDYCLVSLEKTTKSGINVSGNATITMDCGIITNSVSPNAAAASGNSSVTATVVASAGGIQQSNNWNVGKYDPFVPALADPYASLTPDPAEMGCAANPPSLSGSNGAGTTANPGCYSSINVGSNKKLTLNPGVYYISGGGINVQGTLVATGGVSIILTNKDPSPTANIGSFDMNAQAELTIEAPTSGKWKGMAIYQDRRAVDNSPTGNISSNSPNKINGGSTGTIQGVLYFPTQQLTYNGGGNTTAWCTQIVVKRIVFTGNNNTNIKKLCTASGVDPIVGGRRVRLVA